MSPTILFLAILAVGLGLVYHLWRGGGFARLITSIVAASIGVTIGQLIGQFLSWPLIVIGEVHLIETLIGGLLVVVVLNRPT
jgi:hypothetical protein